MKSFRQLNEHALLERALRPGIVVLDLGANHGRFSELLANEYPGEYHAIEANPNLTDELERHPVFQSVRRCAVIGESGPVQLSLGLNDPASSVLPLPPEKRTGHTVTVDGVTLQEIVSDHPGEIDVVKVDIEGAEILALPGLAARDLARIAQITVEFHGSREFGFDISRNTRRTIRSLRRHGFLALDFAPGHRNALFINRRLIDVSRVDSLRWHTEAMLVRWKPTARAIWYGLHLPRAIRHKPVAGSG